MGAQRHRNDIHLVYYLYTHTPHTYAHPHMLAKICVADVYVAVCCAAAKQLSQSSQSSCREEIVCRFSEFPIRIIELFLL